MQSVGFAMRARIDPLWIVGVMGAHRRSGQSSGQCPPTPGQPQNVTAHLDATGAIIVQWDFLALATRYRVRGMLVGVETDYRLIGRSTEPMVSVSDVMTGQTLQIIVQGVNDNLQGVASEPITFMVPAAAQAQAATVETAGSPAVSEVRAITSSNGNSNGHRLPALS